ncbi:MAG: methyltransferase domain-containing protein [Planctomycetia bacterium]|nr:methyltransferase domain-containing protein [Planctomycetia bacterium]
MTRFLRGMARAMVESFTLPDPILEIGSYQVEGQEDLIDLRGLFAGRDYTGVDFRAGPGVDLVANVEELPLPDASVGTVLAFSVFEHVKHFWKGFEEVRRVLRPDGVLLVCCPFYFHVHAYPHDYWRFTPEAFESLLEPYPTRVLGWHGPQRRPLNVWCAAFREEAQIPTAEQYAAYEQKLSEYAKEPLGFGRQLRYALGRLLCGRRPFAPHLDRNNWTSELRTTPRPAKRNRLLSFVTTQIVTAFGSGKRKATIQKAA